MPSREIVRQLIGGVWRTADIPGGGGGGSQPLTSPLQIDGCLLWLDANQIPGVADGDPIDTWPDMSGNGFDATARAVDPSQNEIQTVDITGASGGQYELLDPLTSDPTAPIAWNASATAVRNALAALPSLGVGNVTVTLDTQVYTVEFVGALAGREVGTLGETQDTLDVEPAVNETQGGFESRPVLVAGVQGGKPVARFDVALNTADTPNRQQLDFIGDALNMLAGLDGMSLFMVARGDQITHNGSVYFSNGVAVDSVRILVGSGISVYADDGGLEEISDTWDTALAFGWFSLSFDAAGSGYAVARSSQAKTLVADWSAANAPQAIVDTPSLVAHLGFDEYDPIGWTGDLAEIIVYGRALNAAEQAQVGAYLATKWSLL